MNKLKRPTADYTAIPNELLRDEKLTMRAKGLYCIMFSKPDGWIFYNSCLVSESKEGKDAVRGAMKELTERGWITRTGGGQGVGGVFQPYEYELFLHRGGFSAAAKPSRSDRSGESASTKPDESKTEQPTPQPPEGGVSRIEIEFEEIWQSRWTRGGASQPREPAFKAYKAARKRNISHAAILEGMKARRGVDKPDTEYAPQLATWLNQNRWEREGKGDVSPERSAAQDARAKREFAESERRKEFFRLSRLPENTRKSDEEIGALVETKESVNE